MYSTRRYNILILYGYVTATTYVKIICVKYLFISVLSKVSKIIFRQAIIISTSSQQDKPDWVVIVLTGELTKQLHTDKTNCRPTCAVNLTRACDFD
jgi:hypothetical protein